MTQTSLGEFIAGEELVDESAHEALVSEQVADLVSGMHTILLGCYEMYFGEQHTHIGAVSGGKGVP